MNFFNHFQLIKNIKDFYHDLDERTRRCFYFDLFIYVSVFGSYFLPKINYLQKLVKK